MEVKPEERCPINDTHKRLHQVHLLWHQAEQQYQDPDAFCVNLNSAITTMRSVTFVPQKQGADIPDFEEWYKPWQARLATDELMIWSKKARNRIEKQGDLKTHSIARISLLAGWHQPVSVLRISD